MKFHPRTLTAASGRRIAHAGYAICRTSPSVHALQGSAANTVLGHGFPRLVRGFSSVKGLRGVVHAAIVFPTLDNYR